MSIEVTRDAVPFAMVPHWLTNLSAPAVKLYIVLMRYADNSTREAWPSRQTLAAAMGLKQARSVDSIITELEEAGAVTVRRAKSGGVNLPNRYHLHMNPVGVVRQNALPLDVEGVVHSSAGGSASQRTTVVHENAPELRTKNYNQGTITSDDSVAAAKDDLDSRIRELAKKVHENTKGGYPMMAVVGITKSCVKAGFELEAVYLVLGQLWKNGRPMTKSLVIQSLEGIVKPGQPTNARPDANQRVQAGLSLADKYRQREEMEAHQQQGELTA